jgi:hypothetical protein
MSGPYSIVFRTRCPICGQQFPAGFSRLHYGKVHTQYAKWADRWEFFLYGTVSLAVLVVALVYWFSSTSLHNGYLQAGIVVYVAASFVAWASNLLRVERKFRREWQQSPASDDSTSTGTGG